MTTLTPEEMYSVLNDMRRDLARRLGPGNTPQHDRRDKELAVLDQLRAEHAAMRVKLTAPIDKEQIAAMRHVFGEFATARNEDAAAANTASDVVAYTLIAALRERGWNIVRVSLSPPPATPHP